MGQALIYTRFSCDGSTENSTNTQYRVIKEFAAKSGFQVYEGERFDDKAESGRTGDRDEFRRMLTFIKSGKVKIDTVLVYKYSRFMRNLEESIIYKRLLQQQGIKVVSATENTGDEGPVGKLLENILACIDQFYSDLLGNMVSEGMKEIVRNHYWPGGNPPFGYYVVKEPNKEGHKKRGAIVNRPRLVVHPVEAKIVKRIFEISAETGKGGHLLYEQLCTEMGGPILGKMGAPLNGKRVNDILHKELYKGLYIYGRYGYECRIAGDGSASKTRVPKKTKPTEVYDDAWRIVSDELWSAAERSRLNNQDERKGFGFQNKKAAYALTGLIYCGVCGKKFGGKHQQSRNRTFSDKSDYDYYRCRNAMNGCRYCPNKSKLLATQLESAIIKQINEQLLSEPFLGEIAAEIIAQINTARNDKDGQAVLMRELKECDIQIAGLIALAKKAACNSDLLADELVAAESKKASIVSKLEQVQDAITVPTLEELQPKIQKELATIRERFTTAADIHALRWELARWVDRIRVDCDGRIFIKWKSRSVFELLKLLPVSNDAASGIRDGTIGHSLELLAAWHPLHYSTSAFTGFPGFHACSSGTQAATVSIEHLANTGHGGHIAA